MTLIHIKKVKRPDPQSGEVKEWYAVPSVTLATPKGKKLIPNPAGQEAALFESLEEAESAIRRAGFDYTFEGRKTVTMESTALPNPLQIAANPLRAAVPLLIDRLSDRENTVVSNAALALGELGATEAAPALADILGHDDGSVRKAVADAMAKLVPASLPELRKAWTNAWRNPDKNAPYIRLTVLLAYQELARLQPAYLHQVLPDAVQGLSDDNWLVRAQAALVIGLAAQQQRME